MKRLLILCSMLLGGSLSLLAQKNMQVYNSNNIILQKRTDSVESVQFSNQISTFNTLGATSPFKVSVAAVDSIVFSDERVAQTTDQGTVVTIIYNGSSVTVNNPFASDGVIVSHAENNAHVTVSYAGETKDIEYVVQGTTTNGSLTFDSEKRFTLTLDGASITNPDSAAIHVAIDKSVTVNLQGTSTLSDGINNTGKAAFESKGDVVFTGSGTLNVSGAANHAIFGSDDVTIQSGTVHVTSAAADGMHAENVTVIGGSITIDNAVSDAIECENDLSGVFAITAGTVTINSGDDDSKGIKTDSLISINGGTLNITMEGAAAKALKSDQFVVISGGNTTLTLSGAPLLEASGSGYDPSYSVGVKSAGTVTMTGGSLTITNSGAGGKGISSDGDVLVSGGTLNISTSGAGGSYTNSSATADTYTAACISSDANILLQRGTITCTSSGIGGKGIKADGSIVLGVNGDSNSNLILNVATTGSSYSTGSSSTGGQFGPGGGMQSSGGSDAKAIKATGALIVYSGTITVTTETDGAEGFESKTSITINGGNIYAQCYDDCINSSGIITVNGGCVVCWSDGNDGVDSNYGRTGAFTINNGFLLCISTKGSPEEGLDCDNFSYVSIKGGYLFAGGGAQGSSSATLSGATQGYNFISTTTSFTSTNYYTLADNTGKNIYTVKLPSNLSSVSTLVTAPAMTSGSTYTIKYSTTAPTDYTSAFRGVYLGSTAAGTSSLTSFTAK